MPPHAYFLTKFGTDTSAPRWPFGLNLLAFCLNSGFFVWRSGPPAAGVGLRENCHLGACFFLRASLFSTFLRTLARSSRAFLFIIVIFRVGRPFSCFPPGRPSMRWVGPKIASLRLAPVRAARCRRGLASCMSAVLGGAHFLSSSSYMLVVPRANRAFLMVFEFSRC